MKLNTKLLSIVLSILVIFTVVLMYAVFDSSKKNLFNEKRHTLESVVDVAYKMVEHKFKRISDEFPEFMAKEQSKMQIANLRYDHGVGYLWINDTGKPIPKMVVHPIAPTLNGKLLDNPKYNCAGENKENLFAAAVNVCLDKGEGTVEYMWPKPTKDGKSTSDQPKLSYVKLFKEWQWVLGSGIYVNDVSRQAVANALEVLYIALVVFVIIGVVLWFIINKGISSPIIKVAHAASALSRGEFQQLNLKVSGELKQLVDALNGTKALIDDMDAQQLAAGKLADNLKHLPTPVCEMDADMNVVFMNDAGAGFLGMTPEECVGKKCYELFKTGHCQTGNCACTRAMSEKGRVTADTVARPRPGVNVPITYTGYPITDADGNITGVLEFVVDQSRVYEVAKQLDGTAQKVSKVTGELGNLSTLMSSSSETMSEQSDQVAAATEELNQNVSTVAASTEEAAANVTNMAAAAEQMSQNVGTVASAIEEMNASLKEVAKNTVEAAKTADDAAGKTEHTVGIMSTLSEVARRIDKVVKMISDIADQTNMLALNATIEAASAGEAGKGFAVVAAEVKELAKQTAESTEEIATQIETIQKTASEAGAAVEAVREAIRKNSEISQTIAGSVEEQTATVAEISKTVTQTAYAAKEVARNADEATRGVKEIARSSNEMSQGVREVAGNIGQLSVIGGEVNQGSSNVKDQADSLTQEVDALKQVVAGFELLEQLK